MLIPCQSHHLTEGRMEDSEVCSRVEHSCVHSPLLSFPTILFLRLWDLLLHISKIKSMEQNQY